MKKITSRNAAPERKKLSVFCKLAQSAFEIKDRIRYKRAIFLYFKTANYLDFEDSSKDAYSETNNLNISCSHYLSDQELINIFTKKDPELGDLYSTKITNQEIIKIFDLNEEDKQDLNLNTLPKKNKIDKPSINKFIFPDDTNERTRLATMLNAPALTQNILLVGIAGTGKTFLLKSQLADKNCIFLSFTGLASENYATGETVHHFLGLQSDICTPNTPINIISLEKLHDIYAVVIDEFYNLRCDLFAHLIKTIRVAESTYKRTIPVVCVGDPLQLPPVMTSENKKAIELAWNTKIKSGYPFELYETWSSLDFCKFILSNSRRQDELDFQSNLRQIALNDSFSLSGYRYVINDSEEIFSENVIHIVKYSRDAKNINSKVISKHPEAIVLKSKPLDKAIGFYKTSPVSEKILVFIGMRVMTLVNNTTYKNGTIGTIVKISSKSIFIAKETGKVVEIKPCFVNSADHKGKMILQLPITPAYAFTIHKVQGQTFKLPLYIHLNGIKSYSELYVALSRAKAKSQIHLCGTLKKTLEQTTLGIHHLEALLGNIEKKYTNNEERDRAVLQLIKNNPKISDKELIFQTSLTKKQLDLSKKRLVEAKILTRIGVSRRGWYKVTET